MMTFGQSVPYWREVVVVLIQFFLIDTQESKGSLSEFEVEIAVSWYVMHVSFFDDSYSIFFEVNNHHRSGHYLYCIHSR